MSGPKRNPDYTNTIGVVVVGICGAVLVYVTIVALQAFYVSDTSNIQHSADYDGQESTARKLRSDQLQNIGDVGANTGTSTYRIPIGDAMKLVIRDAKADPSHLIPALPPSTKGTIPPQFGRPKVGGGPAPAAGAGSGAGSAAPESAPGSGAGSAAGGGSGAGSAATGTGTLAPMTPTGAGTGPQPVAGAGAMPAKGAGSGATTSGPEPKSGATTQPKGGATQPKAGTTQPKAGATQSKAGATQPKAGAGSGAGSGKTGAK
jgi:hypothetical protein